MAGVRLLLCAPGHPFGICRQRLVDRQLRAARLVSDPEARTSGSLPVAGHPHHGHQHVPGSRLPESEAPRDRVCARRERLGAVDAATERGSRVPRAGGRLHGPHVLRARRGRARAPHDAGRPLARPGGCASTAIPAALLRRERDRGAEHEPVLWDFSGLGLVGAAADPLDRCERAPVARQHRRARVARPSGASGRPSGEG